jgi:hypothetical protein
MSNLVFNERLKLRATFANNLGIAMLIALVIVPLVATDHGLPFWQELLLIIFGFVLALSCHMLGASVLRGLKEERG